MLGGDHGVFVQTAFCQILLVRLHLERSGWLMTVDSTLLTLLGE